MIVNKRFDDPDKRQEDDPQDAKDVFRDKLLTSSQRQSAMFCVLQIWNYDSRLMVYERKRKG